jgi:AraC-like DNA-binding protein
MFFEQIPAKFILFFMFYGGTALAALIASIYLCLRKGNAFEDSVTPPMSLRRWAATFFAFVFLGHIWWFLFYIYSGDIHSVSCVVIAVLDSVGMLTTIPGMLFAMLQDRKRTIWPIVLTTIPYAVFGVLHIVYSGDLFLNIAIAYILLVYVLFTIYMVFAVRQYGRWLRDNYADLEHKEVWVSHMLVIVFLIVIIIDGFEYNDITFGSFVQILEMVFFGLLLWRIETLPQLESTFVELRAQQPQQQPLNIPANIEQLLAERCINTQLYLQHDLTLLQLAQAVGTNRFYLSQYFSRQGITYNAYINDLRINHFISLYRETSAAQQPIIAQQLASNSGYRSYSTFSLAFKQRMGQSVTAWMRNTANP